MNSVIVTALMLLGGIFATKQITSNNRGFMSHSNWQPPNKAAKYLPAIRRAESKYRIPHNLLARLIYQESRYRDDIIEGRTLSSAGAMGIAQIVPRYHPTAKPLDPFHSIDYAAQYLSRLYRMFNDWDLALASYNWGEGNVSRNRHNRSRWPQETQNYVREISADVNYG